MAHGMVTVSTQAIDETHLCKSISAALSYQVLIMVIIMKDRPNNKSNRAFSRTSAQFRTSKKSSATSSANKNNFPLIYNLDKSCTRGVYQYMRCVTVKEVNWLSKSCWLPATPALRSSCLSHRSSYDNPFISDYCVDDGASISYS
ncbi:hypothetical protein J6590_050940 [Homalodisca vitripennis]|nr:hypothetical protein J6590_050940 [Homalodisca vitripennis]